MSTRVERKKRVNRVGRRNYIPSAQKDDIDYESFEKKLFEGKRSLIQRLFANEDFVEFYETLMLPMTDPPDLKGKGELDSETIYDIIKSDAFSQWIKEIRSTGGIDV